MPRSPVSPAAVLGAFWKGRRPLPGWRSLRIAVAAMIAYLVSLPLTKEATPVLAPLVALLVMQATVHRSIVSGARRVASVVAGVIVAAFLSSLIGLTWWSIGILVFAALLTGSVLRLGEWVTEVPVTALLLLAVSAQRDFAVDRVYQTLIGAAVGVLVNLLLVPPIYVQSAGDALLSLGRAAAKLLTDVADGLRIGWTEDSARRWLEAAWALDQPLASARRALNESEDSLRFNPRQGRARVADESLRNGLSALEHAAITIRGLMTSLLDRVRNMPDEALPGRDLCTALADVLNEQATAVRTFAELVGADVEAPWQAEESLDAALNRARSHPEVLVELLAADTAAGPALWQLHGALLAHLDRLLHEIDPSAGTQANGARRTSTGSEPWMTAMRRVVRQRAGTARQNPAGQASE